jgi:cytochrome P450
MTDTLDEAHDGSTVNGSTGNGSTGNGVSTVTDWATDFDHTDPAWVANPFPIWDDLRQRCPVAHSDRFNGVYLPTRHEDISAIAYDTDHFTSKSVIVNNSLVHDEPPVGGAPPITSDPPFHQHARRALLPPFNPKAVHALEDPTRQLCEQLLDGLEAEVAGGRNVVDAATEYAQHIPPAVIAKMLGLPMEDGDKFRAFIHDVIENVDASPEDRMAGFERLDAYIGQHVAEHVENPRDDLITYLLNTEIAGKVLQPADVFGPIILLLIAGIDTTWSAIGASLFHLAGHCEDRKRLVAEPELLPTAIEELLRAYAPVTMARIVKEPVEIGGVHLEKDQWVLLPFPAANRDPEVFERADEVVIDREVNRHAAFGLGIHRCLGSNLARMELRTAVECWLARFPDFELVDEAAVRWSAGQVRGPRSLPVRILPRV